MFSCFHLHPSNLFLCLSVIGECALEEGRSSVTQQPLRRGDRRGQRRFQLIFKNTQTDFACRLFCRKPWRRTNCQSMSSSHSGAHKRDVLPFDHYMTSQDTYFIYLRFKIYLARNNGKFFVCLWRRDKIYLRLNIFDWK